MKIHFWERDGRKNDADFRETAGSFSNICFILEKGLRKLDCYTDNPEEADFIGLADSLATDWVAPYGKKSFGIFFTDTINAAPTIQIERAKNNPGLRLFSLNNHTADLFKKNGLNCDVIGKSIDGDYWKPTVPKNSKFTFLSTGFTNFRSGVDLLIQAFERAFHKNNNVQLIIKNTPGTHTQLIERINESESNIEYIEKRMTNTELKDLYSSSHVTCNVLRFSGHGLPLAESCLCGSLSLAGDFNPSNELITPNSGVLLKPSGEVAVSDIIRHLVNYWGLTDTFGGLSFTEEPMIYDYYIDEYVDLLRNIYDNYHRYDLTDQRIEL